MKSSLYSGAFSKLSLTCTLFLTLCTTTTNLVVAQDFNAPPAAPADSRSNTNTTLTTLSWGNSGVAVAQLQKALIAAGFYQGDIDSFYGYGVQEAVFNFQQANALAADGIAHPETQRILYENVLTSGNSGNNNQDNENNNSDNNSKSQYIVIVPLKDNQLIYEVQRYAPQAFIAKSGRKQFVHAGAFSSRDQAESLAYLLRSNGFDARVDYR